MDPEQMFIRVQERFSQLLTPRVRATLEYIYLFFTVTLFCILVVMHADYVQQLQPGCSAEFSGVVAMQAQLIHIKMTSAGLWSRNESESSVVGAPFVEIVPDKFELPLPSLDDSGLTFLAAKVLFNCIGSGARKGKLAWKFWKRDTEPQHESLTNGESSKPIIDEGVSKPEKVETCSSFSASARETIKAVIVRFGKKWHRRLSLIWRSAMQIIRGFRKLWNITGIHLNLDIVGDSDRKLPDGITLYSIVSDTYSKASILGPLIAGGKCIVFTETKREADRLSNVLGKSYRCEALHGDISQVMRERTLAGFRDGNFNIFVATDVAARGFDVPNADLVVHFALPRCPETFVHRSGRSVLLSGSKYH